MKHKSLVELIEDRLSPDCSFDPETIHDGLCTLEYAFDKFVAECQHLDGLFKDSQSEWAIEDRAKNEQIYALQIKMKAAIKKWWDKHPQTCPVCKGQFHYDHCVHCTGCHMLICRECHKTFTKENGCDHYHAVHA